MEDDDLVFDETQSNFDIQNRINTIQYQITGDGVDYSTSKNIELKRIFADGGSQTSWLEYKHDFLIDEAWADKNLSVSSEGYDSHGILISGTFETFQLQVTSVVAEDLVI